MTVDGDAQLVDAARSGEFALSLLFDGDGGREP